MKKIINYTFVVASITVLSGLLCILCIWVGALAVEYNLDAFSNPKLTLQYSENFELAKWFNVLDLFGYYLLLLPIVFYLHQQYKFRTPWVPLITFSGLSYVLIGALGASILIAIWPDLMTKYLSQPQSSDTITLLFETITLLVTKGFWNILELIFATIWWFGIGTFLFTENKTLGILTIATGISTLIDVFGTFLEMNIVSEIGLNFYLLFGIIWPISIGVFLLRKSLSLKTVYSEKTETFQSV